MATTTQQIPYALQYHPQDFGSRSRLKEISKVIPHLENGLNCNISVRVGNKTGFQSKGATTNEFENEIDINERGHIFEFRLSGFGAGGKTKIIGFDILTPNLLESFRQ